MRRQGTELAGYAGQKHMARRASRTPCEAALGNTRLGDLFALANAVATTVGGATAIVDSRQSVIAYSAVEGQPIDETRRGASWDFVFLPDHIPTSSTELSMAPQASSGFPPATLTTRGWPCRSAPVANCSARSG